MRLTSSRSLILPGQVLGKYSYLSSSMSGMTAAVTWLPSHNTSSLLIGLGCLVTETIQEMMLIVTVDPNTISPAPSKPTLCRPLSWPGGSRAVSWPGDILTGLLSLPRPCTLYTELSSLGLSQPGLVFMNIQ